MGLGDSQEAPGRDHTGKSGHTDTFGVAPGAVARTVGDETVLVDLDTEQYFSLNATGAVVWASVSSGQRLDAAVDELVRRFDVSREEATDDVAELVAHLTDCGLLVPNN